MRRLLFVLCVLAFASAPALGDDGQISKGALARMGLSGMRVMPDREASQIRGTSIAFTFSMSTGFPIVSINSPVDIGAHHAFSASVGISGGAIAGGFAFASAH